MDEIVIGAIVPVGIGAPIGDVTVAAVVISPDIDKVVRLEAEQALDGSQELWVDHSRGGRLFKLQISRDNAAGVFKYAASQSALSSTPDQFLGARFEMLARLAKCSKVVGFCPKTAPEAFSRTQVAMQNLRRLLLKDYPKIVLVSDALEDVSDKDRWMRTSWESATPAVPSSVYRVTEEARQSLSQTQQIQVVVAGLVAEAIAAGVRAARTLDLSEIYPPLRLESNWGFGDQSLHGGLTRYLSFEERGFRGELTEQWMRWFETHRTPAAPETGVTAPMGFPDVDPAVMVTGPAPSAGDPLAGWNPNVEKDAKGRKSIQFDKDRALYMSTRLMTEFEKHGHTWDTWEQTFVPSIDSQLKTRRLSGRQMYLLWQKFKEHC